MPSVTSLASKAIGYVTKSRPMNYLYKQFEKDPVGALAKTTIASIALKDGIGCGMYVYQSLNNDKIPEKRRKFVSALDLTNGLLMILAQIGLFFGMRKLNRPIFNKLFGKSFGKGKEFEKVFTEQLRADQKAAEIKPTKKHIISNLYNAVKEDKFETFGTISELVASTIIGKRIIVPFIATPLASKVEKYMDSKDAKEKGAENEIANDNSQVPMKGKLDIVSQEDNTTKTEPENTNLLAKYKK